MIAEPVDRPTLTMRRWMDLANGVLSSEAAQRARRGLGDVLEPKNHLRACEYVKAPGSPHVSKCTCGLFVVWESLQPWCLECGARHGGDCR